MCRSTENSSRMLDYKNNQFLNKFDLSLIIYQTHSMRYVLHENPTFAFKNCHAIQPIKRSDWCRRFNVPMLSNWKFDHFTSKEIKKYSVTGHHRKNDNFD